MLYTVSETATVRPITISISKLIQYLSSRHTFMHYFNIFYLKINVIISKTCCFVEGFLSYPGGSTKLDTDSPDVVHIQLQLISLRKSICSP